MKRLDTDPTLNLKIFRSYCIIIDILKDRKYIVPEDYELDINTDFKVFEDWVVDQDGNLDMNMLHLEFEKENGSKILTFWFPTLGKNDVQEVFESLVESKLSNAIIIHVNKITSSAIPIIKNCKIQKYNIESFMLSELQFNFTKHVLVPEKHIICSAKKKAEILEKYSVTKEKLPKILSTDPQCRYLGAAKGQLIKIVRNSTSIPYITIKGENKKFIEITYRLVV